MGAEQPWESDALNYIRLVDFDEHVPIEKMGVCYLRTPEQLAASMVQDFLASGRRMQEHDERQIRQTASYT